MSVKPFGMIGTAMIGQTYHDQMVLLNGSFAVTTGDFSERLHEMERLDLGHESRSGHLVGCEQDATCPSNAPEE